MIFTPAKSSLRGSILVLLGLALVLAGCASLIPAQEAANPTVTPTDCGCSAFPTPGTPTPGAGFGQPPGPGGTGAETPAAGVTEASPAATDPALPGSQALQGFVVFDRYQSTLQGYSLTGQPLPEFSFTVPGLTQIVPNQVQVVGRSVYYYDPTEQAVVRVNSAGSSVLTPTRSPAGNTTGTFFSVSPDEQLIAWSVDQLTSDPMSSAIWIAQTDGSNAREAVRIDTNGFQVLRPYQWSTDGALLYEQAPMGIGGYIPFHALNSLYRLDPASGATQAVVEAAPNPALCISTINADQSQIVSACPASGESGLALRDLATGSETVFPAVEEQGLVGSALFAPSGDIVVYGVARGNPDGERGQVVIAPTSSAAPTSIWSQEGALLRPVAWVSPQLILVEHSSPEQISVWVVNVDGSNPVQLATGQFVGLLQ